MPYESSGPTVKLTKRGAHLRKGRPVRDHIMKVREPVRGSTVDCQYAALAGIIDSGDFAILSASKSDNPDVFNNTRNFVLEGELKAEGHHPIPLAGYYEGEREEAWLVPHIPLARALHYARSFGQESIIHGHRLIEVGRGQTILQFNPEKTIYGPEALKQKSYSRNRQGTAFSLQP